MANKTKVTYEYKPSNMPFLVIGIVWAIQAFILPMYKYISYVILLIVSIVAFVVMRKLKIFKDIAIRHEEELSYEEMELEDVLSTGQTYVDSFQDSKNKIHNYGVRTDIEEVIRLSNLILDEVRKDPKDVKKIRKFIAYYLPMIDKMLKSYVEFEKTTSSKQIEESKRKIEDMLKTIQKAFTSLYDSLHEDEALDVTADMKVLEQLMEQEGYLKK